MAKITTASSSEPTNQLRKLLQNQQEPFTLEVYLSEKGCGRNNLTSEANFILSSDKFLNKSGTKNKSKKSIIIIPHFPKVLKLVLCNIFFTIKGLRKPKSFIKQETIEADNRFSSSSCSDRDIDFPLVAAQTGQESFILPKLITEESILSATLWDSILQTTAKEQSSCCQGFSTSGRALQQTKQLLFDCVKELVAHEGEGKRFLGSDQEIGNVICEKIKGWSKQRGDETNIKDMLELDIMESKHEWDNSEIESQKRKMGKLLGNAILEELTSEFVMDMVDVFSKK